MSKKSNSLYSVTVPCSTSISMPYANMPTLITPLAIINPRLFLIVSNQHVVRMKYATPCIVLSDNETPGTKCPFIGIRLPIIIAMVSPIAIYKNKLRTN